jgi:predicted O-methyltransferase YrrM
MTKRLKSILKRCLGIHRECSQGEMIERLLAERRESFREKPVFVETGCGASTISLSRYARELNALAYSLDCNSEKSDYLKSHVGDQVAGVEFVIGESLESLAKIVAEHTIDFLFLDSAPSAMHTLREFLICEPGLEPGACVVVDNAALPGERWALGPVRKGRILVPYLLASPYWDVRAHRRAGDSMVSAILHSEADFADPAHEHPDYTDNWRRDLDRSLTPDGRAT